jgi:hypothetical protein
MPYCPLDDARPHASVLRSLILLMVIVIFLHTRGTAQTITYSSLTSPNASAGSANVSKAQLPSVLPATMQAKVYAHLLTWFGSAIHTDVGYSSK